MKLQMMLWKYDQHEGDVSISEAKNWQVIPSLAPTPLTRSYLQRGVAPSMRRAPNLQKQSIRPSEACFSVDSDLAGVLARVRSPPPSLRWRVYPRQRLVQSRACRCAKSA